MFKSKKQEFFESENVELKQFVFNNLIINIPETLLIKIKDSYNTNREIGGYMIGYKIFDTNEFTLVGLTFPNMNDVSNSVSFEISKQHKKFANKKQSKVNKIIGFWHTHPASFGALPSNTDMYLFDQIKMSTSLSKNVHLIYASGNLSILTWDGKNMEVLKCQL